MKRCPRCGRTKTLDEFYHFKTGLVRVSGYCRPCYGEVKKQYQESAGAREKRLARERAKAKTPLGKKQRRESKMRARYGITPDDYNEMLEAQGGACAICDEVPDYVLGVDHDHHSGLVRGLLCRKCNHGRGFFDDDMVRITRALDYLRDAALDQQERGLPAPWERFDTAKETA